MVDFTGWQWLLLVRQELLLFAGVFFLIGAIDEFAVDCIWIWLRLTGRASTATHTVDGEPDRLTGPAAIFIPAWQEASVIGATISHALAVWPYINLRIYAGCYRNDPATMAAIILAAKGDRRMRLVVHDVDGPSTKADCLNRLYRALASDEERAGQEFHMVVLHDAEDMVDGAALGLLDRAICKADLAQIPVLPVPQASSPWVAGHYCEEFAEAHGKAMVVRDLLETGMPLAGVGCAISRKTLARLATNRPDNQPFAPECLTEDYELGIGVSDLGGKTRFIRRRHHDGRLVATRACFPATLDQAVRQKTRWVHGIAFQGWDRLGWSARPAEFWMRLRDRRGPFTALVLAVAYLLLIMSAGIWLFSLSGFMPAVTISPTIKILLGLNFASFLWRAVWRFGFTAREYGIGEGLRAIIRIPVANIIAIMSGRRAFVAYSKTLAGAEPLWDKTDHKAHPALMSGQRQLA